MRFRLPKTTSFTSNSNRRGFTLIELMVAIAIVAILATVGITSYSQSQKLARDAKRKSDLQNIKNALMLYHQDFKTFPVPTDSGCSLVGGTYYLCTSANSTTPWIKGLDSNYIGSLPKDPLTNTGDPSLSTSTNSGYAYRSYVAGVCPGVQAGQIFILYTRLENTSDPQTIGAKNFAFCNGTVLSTAPSPNTWASNVYMITSYD